VRLAYLAAAAALTALPGCTASKAAQVGVVPAPAAGHEVVIYDYKFQPKTLTVTPGTTLIWVNRDMAPHTATHRSFSDEPFDSGNITAYQKFAHTFRTPGTYSYLCMLHQGMTGTVVVEAQTGNPAGK
jgi:plastocyanin